MTERNAKKKKQEDVFNFGGIMSEYLNNKQNVLKDIIKKLHDGAGVDNVKKEFHNLIKNVSPDEISQMEQSLIEEGFPAEEVQRLCEVHVEVFKTSLLKQKNVSKLPGHPVHTFFLENKKTKSKIKILKKSLKILKKKNEEKYYNEFQDRLDDLRKIEIHYQRKENQLFPYLEKKKFTGPSKVMWGKHDEIRKLFKDAENVLQNKDYKFIENQFNNLFSKISKMIFMEEKILFPTALKKLEEREWALIRKGESEIGYAWIKPGNVWDAGIILQKSMEKTLSDAKSGKKSDEKPGTEKTNVFNLDVGALSLEQINLMLKALPVDITYIDEYDKVLYYTGSEERVFPRSPAIIGRDVQNCHPQKSVHIVNDILKAFKEKTKKVAEFWITMNNMFVYIRYFAVYDKSGAYKGCIEVSQDITDIRKLEGDKRLLDW